MGVRLDLTAITPELIDAVICMDNSPAYAAFKEEIEAILANFNETGHLSISGGIDPADLTSKSEDTLKNMHKAFLIWGFSEEKKSGVETESCCHNIGKLFFKSQQNTILAKNNGEPSFDTRNAKALIDSFKAEVNSNAEVFNSIKEFFKGYVYGYFFNYLKECSIMKEYAEMLVYLGVMSGKVTATVSEQQKTLPKMAMLLPNDRFKYLSGFVPTQLTMDIVFDRIELATLSAAESDVVRKRITDYILANWKTEREDGVDLIKDDVTASFASSYFAVYTDAFEFAGDIYKKSTFGTRMFLDCDRDDSGDYTHEKINEIIADKCVIDCGTFYSEDRAPVNDCALGCSELGYRYPVVYKGSEHYFFSPIYEEFVYPVLDKAMYINADIPSGVYPFADELFSSNPIRRMSGISDSSITIRRDRQAVLEQLRRLTADTIMSDRDREMNILEQMLCLVSGNCESEQYRKLVVDNVFNTELYGIYMRYRAELLAGGNLNDFKSRKALLDVINKIN